jgi:hypothetical protein
MKNLYMSFFLLLCCAICHSQIINIPDSNLKSRLLIYGVAAFNDDGTDYSHIIDANGDGEIQMSEASLVTGLNLRSTNNRIASAEGLQYFTNLKRLTCSGNSLTSLDVSMLSSLVYLNCGNNNIVTLNVLGLGQLKELWCNNNDLTTLNTEGLTSIETLLAHVNNLSSLNLNTMPALKGLKISGNEFTTLDLTTSSTLEVVECSANPLTQLTVANMGSMLELVASGTLISSVDVSGMVNLRHLDVSYNAIASINVTTNSALLSLNVTDNPLTEIELNNALLEDLSIGNTLVSTIDCSSTAVRRLYCSSNENLTSINVQNGALSFSDPDMLFYAFMFEDLPNLTSICVDNGEQNNLAYTNFNIGGNAHIYSGENCDVEVFMGLNENTLSSFILYPNPTATTVTIAASNNKLVKQIVIYDILGQLVREYPANSNHNKLDITDLSTGTYVVKILIDNVIETRKLVKI